MRVQRIEWRDTRSCAISGVTVEKRSCLTSTSSGSSPPTSANERALY